jgi:hypothetical protein
MSALFLGACTVGEVPLGGGDGGGADAMTGCVNRSATPPAPHTHLDGVTGTGAGKGCVSAACHLAGLTGTNAPAFFAGGTVYKPDKTTGQAGATVRLNPMAGGAGLTAITDTAGNFYWPMGVANPMPATTSATACPADVPMIQQISNATDANCNSASCHQQPGGVRGGITFMGD